MKRLAGELLEGLRNSGGEGETTNLRLALGSFSDIPEVRFEQSSIQRRYVAPRRINAVSSRHGRHLRGTVFGVLFVCYLSGGGKKNAGKT